VQRAAAAVPDPEQYRFLQERGVLLGAFDRRTGRAGDAGFRGQFRLLDWEEELIRTTPASAPPSPVSRLDAFFVTSAAG
jgi:hypothetical protein